jgi:HAD superfamily hydrolase (TIGR01509 family)
MRTRAVLLDALGTLVELEPPWEHAGALGDGVPRERLIAALRAEMAYYREHSHEGRDPDSLADLRERCAAVVSRELGRPVSAEALMEAIRFHAFPDAAPALESLRARELSLVCVSNWDSSLPEVLARCGLGGALDAVVASATAGSRKPDVGIFAAALAAARCSPEEAVHVGDTPEEDLEGARAAGIRALLLDRGGGGDIASLGEIDHHLDP